MKVQKLIAVLVFICSALAVVAQETKLVAYQGGFFVKNDSVWEEYRPADRCGRWSAYTQYKENDNFYYLRNEKCQIAVPKQKQNHVYIMKQEKWEKIYTTIDVYGYCPEEGRLFYCYDGGYFLRDNDVWREYRPEQKYALWNEFKQTEEQDYFFILENSKDKIAVPKNEKNNIYIMRDENWRLCYKVKAVYDKSADCDFNFYFANSKIADEDDRLKSLNCSARLSFSRRGCGQISYNNVHRDFTFNEVSALYYKDGEVPVGVELMVDDGSRIRLIGSDVCAIEQSDGAYLNFVNANKENELDYIIELVENEFFFK